MRLISCTFQPPAIWPVSECLRSVHGMPDGSSTAHLYRPKLVSTLLEGYGLDSLRHDALAGLTVAVVALPLSMAIAVASGVTPERGLFTAIVGGFLVSALGSLIRYIPHPVTVGFTSGIAATIFASQLRDLGGLTLAGAEPGPLLAKLSALGEALPTLNWSVGRRCRRFRPDLCPSSVAAGMAGDAYRDRIRFCPDFGTSSAS